MGIPVMIALRDFMNFMKSLKSIKMLDFHLFWLFCWTWSHLEISMIPNRPDNVEKHENVFSNFSNASETCVFEGKNIPTQHQMGMPVMIALGDFMKSSKSKKSIKIIDFWRNVIFGSKKSRNLKIRDSHSIKNLLKGMFF